MTLELRVLLSLILAGSITAGVFYVRHRLEVARDGEKAVDIATDAAPIQQRQQAVEVRVVVARETYSQQVRELEKNDPIISERADRIVPVGMRELACRRRHAREGTAGECPHVGAEEDAAQR